MLLAVESENGSSMHACDSDWTSFYAYVTPGTDRQTVQERFAVLYDKDRGRAFRYAMRFGNLRDGSCGTADMQSWMACMEVVWEKNPLHLIANIRCIMEDVSCKWALTLLKHFSNPDESHGNNYWGNLMLAEQHKKHRLSYRYFNCMVDNCFRLFQMFAMAFAVCVC